MTDPEATQEGRVDRASLIVHATADVVYRAFEDPDAFILWLPPQGMTGRLLRYEFREGGNYEIELTYRTDTPAGTAKTTENSDLSRGTFLEIVPAHRIVMSVEFDSGDPAFAGTMIMTWTFESHGPSTWVTVAAAQVPPGIAAPDHETGLAASLENLARYLG
ncbi:SRPBCC domain-containing protein [Sphingosinicella terrae]|uniref:SRPBCC domain-containing protein n=1 Tax=Sphingosinicella terrae TaxID=2172047 RepID=UPI000E0D4E2B|nr:SRPBCC domain-containing protein [Sphingosinicella terrae]